MSSRLTDSLLRSLERFRSWYTPADYITSRDRSDVDALLEAFGLAEAADGSVDLGPVQENDGEEPLPQLAIVSQGLVLFGQPILPAWKVLHPQDVRLVDMAAAVKRGILPIDTYRTDTGVAPGPGTVYHSPKYQRLHAALGPSDMVYDTTGSLIRLVPPQDAAASSFLSRVSAAVLSVVNNLGRA
ncbi:hypothetical protein BKA70DRAFT_1229940 [Coprinopsis sp. MPI-PUGE-AT-0042]|nr:hypothetical protein BKA70DRAFT_1229940 [Coprinopsis sp. MPI-PUGE-AT-0042]